MVTLAEFINSVAFDTKDASWNECVLANLEKNEIMVICVFFACSHFAVLCWFSQTVEVLSLVNFEDVVWENMTPGKRVYAKVLLAHGRQCECFMQVVVTQAIFKEVAKRFPQDKSGVVEAISKPAENGMCSLCVSHVTLISVFPDLSSAAALEAALKRVVQKPEFVHVDLGLQLKALGLDTLFPPKVLYSFLVGMLHMFSLQAWPPIMAVRELATTIKSREKQGDKGAYVAADLKKYLLCLLPVVHVMLCVGQVSPSILSRFCASSS